MPSTPRPKSLAADPHYRQFVADLKARVESARLMAARSINRELVALYWDIGCDIVERQKTLGWGDGVVEKLAADLRRAFPEMRGFSEANVWRMRQLYLVCSEEAFLAQVVRETKNRPALQTEGLMLEEGVPQTPKKPAAPAQRPILAQAVRELLTAVPWGHHVLLLGRIKSPPELFYYLRATARFGWSRNVLLNQLKARAFERSRREGKSHNFPAALPAHFAEQAEEALKSSYNLEFLGLGRAVRERELEDRLVGRLRDFILELGYGFCFVGRQYRLALGAKEYFVDLLFYHRFLKTLVAIDLKIGPFEPEFAGKMDFYLNLLNDRERAPDDRPSIGIILCAEKDSLEVEYALRTKGNPIGVAEYQLQPKLPAALRGKLPTARQLADAVRPMLPAARASA